MSSDADAIVAQFDSFYVGNLCGVAAAVVFIYDTFVTFDREVTCFWAVTGKRTGASLLFFANRWISLIVYILGMIEFAPLPTDKSCGLLSIAEQAFTVLQFMPGAAFSALRAYVLSRSKLLGIFVFALALAPVAANLVVYGYQFTGKNFPPFGCFHNSLSETAALDLRFVVIISRVPLIVADILLIYITWTKLSGRATPKDLRQSSRFSLSNILLRDGIIYFVYVLQKLTNRVALDELPNTGVSVLFVLNVLHLVLSATAVWIGVGLSASSVTIFTSPITAILISRFLLELQEANQMVVRLDPNDSSDYSRSPYDTPSFISSLGGFINPDLSASSDDDYELHGGALSEGGEEGDSRRA